VFKQNVGWLWFTGDPLIYYNSRVLSRAQAVTAFMQAARHLHWLLQCMFD